MATCMAIVACADARSRETTFSLDHQRGCGRRRPTEQRSAITPRMARPFRCQQGGPASDGHERVHHDAARPSAKLKHGNDTLTVTVLAETQEVDGVVTGVLEERETKNGTLVEVSRNFMATDKNTGDVYYFGEDVDNYKNGKVVDHESAWRAGTGGARFGLMIPAKPTVGQAFYQEIAPKVAMDRVEVVSTHEIVKTPAGTFEGCVHLRETTPLERGVSHKYLRTWHWHHQGR